MSQDSPTPELNQVLSEMNQQLAGISYPYGDQWEKPVRRAGRAMQAAKGGDKAREDIKHQIARAAMQSGKVSRSNSEAYIRAVAGQGLQGKGADESVVASPKSSGNGADVSHVSDVSVTGGERGQAPAPTPTVDGAEMLQKVHAFLGRFVVYPSEHAHNAHAIWCVHTHLMHLWDSTPRIAFLSPEPKSGKSRALEVSELLVPNPVMAVNVSPTYLFRKVGSGEIATILFDEIDTVFGPKAKENEEIRGLLNAGHRKGAVAGRCVVHGAAVETEEIPAYAAVALAGLGWLPDTIMSRSVIVRMRRRHAGERIEPFRRRVHAVKGDEVRRLIEAWVLGQPKEIIEWPELPKGVDDRDADVWESLIAVADMAGGDWPERARVAAVALVEASREDEPSLGIRLLGDLKTVFGDAQQMTTVAVLNALHAMPEAPWHDMKGRPLDDRRLAVRLRQYGVKPCALAVGNTRPRGYRREDLFDAWQRYFPPPPADKSTTSTTATTTTDDVADVADVAEFPASGRGDTDPNIPTVPLDDAYTQPRPPAEDDVFEDEDSIGSNEPIEDPDPGPFE